MSRTTPPAASVRRNSPRGEWRLLCRRPSRQAGSSFGVPGTVRGQVVVDHLVPRERGPDHGLQDGDARDGQEGAQRPEQRRPGDDRPERDRRVHVHGVRGHPGRERHVLELLVEDDEPEQDERLPRRVEEGDQQRDDRRDVGSHSGDELRDQAHPERQRHGERHAQDGQYHEGTDARDDGQQHARVQIAAGLVDRDLPDAQDLVLPSGRHERERGAAHAGPVGDEVEREERDGEYLEDRARRSRRRCRGRSPPAGCRSS